MAQEMPSIPRSIAGAIDAGTLRAGLGYFLANVINKAALFVLTILLARALPTDSMGALSVFQVWFLFAWTAMGLGSGTQVARILTHADYRDRSRSMGSLLVVVALAHVLFVVLAAVVVAVGGFRLERVYLLLPICSYAHCYYQAGLAWLRQTNRLKTYLWTDIPCVTLSALVSLSLVYHYGMDWQARIVVMTGFFAIYAGAMLVIMSRCGAIRLPAGIGQLWPVMSLGKRLVGYLLLMAMIGYLDRVLLSALQGEAAAGIYSVYFQLSLLVVLVMEAFLKAWSPWVYSALNSGQAASPRFIQSFRLFMVLGLVTSLLAIAACVLCVPWLLGEAYQSHALVIVPLAFAQWFY